MNVHFIYTIQLITLLKSFDARLIILNFTTQKTKNVGQYKIFVLKV